MTDADYKTYIDPAATSEDANTYSNRCVDTSVDLFTNPNNVPTAYGMRCMRCDAAGNVLWPAPKVNAAEKWIPAGNCGL